MKGEQHEGLTVQELAEAKCLPAKFLTTWGVQNIETKHRGLAVAFPWYEAEGVTERPRATHLRHYINKGDGEGPRYTWWLPKQNSILPFGAHRIQDWLEAPEAGDTPAYVWVCESEIDALTFWLHDEPAIAYGGANFWRQEWARLFDGFDEVRVVREPDSAGLGSSETIALDIGVPSPPERPMKSAVIPSVKVVPFPLEHKDANALHLAVDGNGQRFHEELKSLVGEAITLDEIKAQHEQEETLASAAEIEATKVAAGDLLESADVLHRAILELERLGVVGERKNIGLIRLAIRSRALTRPINVEVSSPSTSGKTHLISSVLALEHPDAFYELTASSEKALIYLTADISHRHIYIQEPEGLAEGVGNAAIKSLVWEGRLKYETVVMGPEGVPESKHIEKDGPTGLIISTTKPLEEQLSTRMIRTELDTSEEQTNRILDQIALQALGRGEEVDLEPWKAMSKVLGEPAEVVVPFSVWLKTHISPRTLRVRRDFTQLITLIKASAVEHRFMREVEDESGALVASVADYAVAHAIASAHFAAVQAEGVTEADRLYVVAVDQLSEGGAKPVSQADLGRHLKASKTAVSNRVKRLLTEGYIDDQKERGQRGVSSQLVPGSALPAKVPPLPYPCELSRHLYTNDFQELVVPWVDPVTGEHHDCELHDFDPEKIWEAIPPEQVNTDRSKASRSGSEAFIGEVNTAEHLNSIEGKRDDETVQPFSIVQSPYERSEGGDAKPLLGDRSTVQPDGSSDKNPNDRGKRSKWRAPL